MKILDKDGLAYFWTKIKAYVSGLGYMLKTATNKVTVKEFLFRDVDDDALRIGGGSSRSKGANILLYGKDHENSGRVDFQAYDGTNYSTLKFEPTETRPVFYWLNGYGSGSEQIAYLTDIPSIPNLSKTVSGNGNAITDVSVSGHAITFTKGTTFLTSHQDISGKVNKSGDTMTGTLYGTSVTINNTFAKSHEQVTKGTVPSSTYYWTLNFADKNGTDFTNNVLAQFESRIGTDNKVYCYMRALKNTAATTTNVEMGVVYDTNNSTGWAYCPTPAANSNDTSIATTEWVKNKNYALDSSVVHTTGNEDISGVKNFNNSIYEHYGYYLYNDSLEYDKLPSETKYSGFVIRDKNSEALGRVLYSKDSSGICRLQLNVGSHGYANLGSSGYLGIVTNPDYNTAYATAPTFEQWDSNGDVVATTYWVRHATGNTSLNAASATELKNARAFRVYLNSTSTDSFDGTANCTPGVTGILGVSNGGTGLSSLSTFVRTTGTQTIAGTKTFSDTMVFNSANIKHADNNHAFYVCGGNGNAATNGAYMILCGSGWTDNPGKFYLRATTTSSNTRSLIGTPGGNLTWNGAVIQTSSDARLKTPMSDVPDDVLDAWEEVRWGRFKMLDAIEEKGTEKARFHVGLIAQQAKAAFDVHDLDGCAYGILCYDDHDFNDLWMVRYTEALCMEAAYQRRENARLKKRVADLEERLAALELKIA